MNRRRLWYIAGAGALIIGILLLALNQHLVHDPISRVAPEERGALFESNFHNFLNTCGDSPEELKLTDFCKESAEVLRRFPECQDECRTRTAPFVESRPTR